MVLAPRAGARALKTSLLICTFAVIGSQAWAQTPAAPQRPPILMLRYDEDWRPLRDPALRTEPLDALKLIPLGDEGWLSFGGEARLRYESADALGLGFGGAGDEDFLLGRLYLHADAHLTEELRVFVELRSVAAWGEARALPPTQDSETDIAQAFVDTVFAAPGGRFTVRAGRQEIALGASRLVTFRDGPNVRLAFDGVRTFWTDDDGWRVDAFYLRPVLSERDAFDDQSTEDYQFWGVHLDAPIASITGLRANVYYFGLDRSLVRFGQGAAPENQTYDRRASVRPARRLGLGYRGRLSVRRFRRR